MSTFDQRLADEAWAADQCMKLGAIVLKPQRKSVGFAVDKPPVSVDPEKIAREISQRRRTS